MSRPQTKPIAPTTPAQPAAAPPVVAALDDAAADLTAAVPVAQDDLQIVRVALDADMATVEGLRAIEAGRQALSRVSHALTDRLHRSRTQVAEYREKLRVLKSRLYHSPKSGQFKVTTDEPHNIFTKKSHPIQYAAIVAGGRVGEDFEFVLDAE
jgi:hypothetical protein